MVRDLPGLGVSSPRGSLRPAKRRDSAGAWRGRLGCLRAEHLGHGGVVFVFNRF